MPEEKKSTNESSAALPLAGFFFWFGLTFAAAALAGYGSVSAKEFYAQLVRPPWAPPSRIFGIVWTVLYVLIGFAAFFVSRRKGQPGLKAALSLYSAQLALISLWPWLFFAWREGFWAFVEIALLWGLALATLVAFWRVSRLAAVLFAPYFLWVSFATVLSWTVWRLNPALL